MKAIVPISTGSNPISFADVDEPCVHEHQLVLAVEAFSMNRGESFVLEKPTDGWRPGKDVAGTVVRAAADGRGPAVGERVVAHPEWGGWAERVAVDVDRVAVLTPGIPSSIAAALPLAGVTALRLLRSLGSVSSQRILLTGASGGVGHYFVELAAAQGALITAVSSSLARGRRLRELGANKVVSAVEDADGVFEIGLDSVGGTSTGRVLKRLADRGRLVWFGQASRTPVTLDFFDWSGGANATIRKFHYAESDVPLACDLATLVRLVEHGRLHPHVGLMADWADTARVLAELVDRRVVGNAVLTVS